MSVIINNYIATDYNKLVTVSSSFAIVVLLVLTGAGMQGYANGTIDAFFVSILLLFGGFVIVSLFSSVNSHEMRVFLLTYAVCVFVGGLVQCYSLNVFNNPQSTLDSCTFFRQISPHPPFATMTKVQYFNSPLAVLIWQQFYRLTWWLGFDFAPYTGVMCNALFMGFAGSLTVRTARELFGNDDWRLQRVGTLFAFCGIFILFGAVLLRDCFTTFFNALVLWGLVRYLIRKTLLSLVLATVLTVFSAYAMFFLRRQAVVLFVLYGCLAFLFWFLSKSLNTARLLAAIFAMGILLVATTYFLDFVQTYQGLESKGQRYDELSSNTHSEDSLGMRLIVSQPLPIRLVLGSGMSMVSPIPLWVNFKIGSVDYHWIKGYHGIYQVIVLPLVFAGFIISFRMFRQERERAVPFLFLATYLLINTAAVVATSLEQRHIAQFMPAFMILAALPDTREAATRTMLRSISIKWFVLVVLVHLVWAIMKG